MKKFLPGVLVGLLLAFLFYHLNPDLFTKVVDKEVKVESIVETPGKTETVVKYKTRVVVKQEKVNVPQIVEKEVCHEAPKEAVVVAEPANKNGINVLLGSGPTNLSKSYPNANQVEVSTQTGVVYGASYERRFDSGFELGVGGLSNSSFFLSAGKGF